MMKINNNPNEPSSKTQCQRILAYLQTGRSITQLEALRLFQTMRLGARIADLKAKGYNITSILVKDANTGKRYSSYRLVTAPVQGELFSEAE